MAKGIFLNNVPLIQVGIAWGQAVQNSHFILDTGFTGDLQVSDKIAVDLGLQITGVENVRIANGSVIRVPTALAVTFIDGIVRVVTVLISNGALLAGIGFFSKFGFKAIVDCKFKTVELLNA
ncbi:hypothetical protein A3B60_02415 [Candidatus Peregrinibacteria bacterium RIFCSPLOWO2_01_FULL_39_12]|nr:MAG: hypothetical protein A3B60_02415 [Candidatus Peregrinibacteria bacterium RIFCSPLOWO2_01_FULL_39_12]